MEKRAPVAARDEGMTSIEYLHSVDLKRAKIVKKPAVDLVDFSKLERTVPHSPDAEKGILGCILIDPKKCLSECLIKMSGNQMFYDLRNQEIFNACVQLESKAVEIDVITLKQYLKDKNILDNVGGIAYLSELPDAVPSAANLEYYLDIVVEQYLLRTTIQTCTEIIGRVYKNEGSVEVLLDGVERDILKIGDIRNVSKSKQPSAKELVSEAVDMIEKLFISKGAISGIPTGLIDLDKLTDGLHAGDLVLISGYPSTGKSSLVMNILEHIAVDLHRSAGIILLEMTPQQLMMRLQCSRARVNLRDIGRGTVSEEGFKKMTMAGSQLARSPLHIRSESGLNIGTMKAMARRMKQQHGIEVLIIDYMQRMNAMGARKNSSRAEELGMISAACKDVAMELGIPLIVPSQLNDTGEIYGGREPGHDADTHIKLKNDGEWKPDIQTVNAIIDKQRHGPAGEVVKLTFLKTITRFECAAKIDVEE